MSGYDGKFRPGEELTRAEAITILIKAIEIDRVKCPQEEHPCSNILSRFSDSDAIPKYARQLIATAIQKKLLIVSPKNRDMLQANQPVTRGEVAALTYSGFQLGEVQ